MSEKTALSLSPREGKSTEVQMSFADMEHERFYHEKLKRAGQCNCYVKALVYLLGISGETRRHFKQIYDMKKGCIKPECLHQGWQTGGTRRIIRLAFNLYTDRVPNGEGENEEERMDECRQYSVSSIFCSEYARYFWEGIKLRYPDIQ